MIATSPALRRCAMRLVPHRVGCSARALAPERDELVERHHLRVGEAAQALHVEHDDLAAGRGVRSRTARILSSCSSSSTNRILGVAVVDEILDLGRRVGRVDAGRDARRRTGRPGRRTATPCCCRRGWRRARPAAARARSAPCRWPWRASPYSRPGVGLPDAAVLLAHGDLVAARLHAMPEQASGTVRALPSMRRSRLHASMRRSCCEPLRPRVLSANASCASSASCRARRVSFWPEVELPHVLVLQRAWRMSPSSTMRPISST